MNACIYKFGNLTSKLSLFLIAGLALIGNASTATSVVVPVGSAAALLLCCSLSFLVFLRMVAVSNGGRGGSAGLGFKGVIILDNAC